MSEVQDLRRQLERANRVLVAFSTAMAALLPEVRFIQQANERAIKGEVVSGDDHTRLLIAALKLHDAAEVLHGKH